MWSVLSEECRYGFGEQRGLLRRHRVRCSRNRVAARLGQAPLDLGDDSLEERWAQFTGRQQHGHGYGLGIVAHEAWTGLLRDEFDPTRDGIVQRHTFGGSRPALKRPRPPDRIDKKRYSSLKVTGGERFSRRRHSTALLFEQCRTLGRRRNQARDRRLVQDERTNEGRVATGKEQCRKRPRSVSDHSDLA